MHQVYNPENIALWLHYYGDQAAQTGYGVMPGFKGTPYQRGGGLGSFFRSLFRMAVPVLKSVGKTVGKQALSTGSHIAADLVQGRTIGDAAEEHGRTGLSHLLHQAGEAVKPQRGNGLGDRRREPKRNTTKPIKAARQSTNDIFGKKTKNGSRRRRINAID